MASTPAPGQFGVVRTKGFVQAMIRLFTRSQVNHAFLVLDGGKVIEAQTAGAIINPLSKYDGHEVVYSRITLTADQVADVITAACSLRGTPYNFLDIVAIGLGCLGIDWPSVADRAQRADRLICSQLVDRAYRLAGIHLYDDGRPDGGVTPGDLLMWIAADRQPAFVEKEAA